MNPGRVTKIQFPVPQRKFVPLILKQKAKKTLRKEANSLSSVNELEIAFSKSPGNTHYGCNFQILSYNYEAFLAFKSMKNRIRIDETFKQMLKV